MSLWDDIVNVVRAGISDADAAASKAVAAVEALASGDPLDALADITDAAFDAANAEFGTAISEVTQALHVAGQPVETIGMGLLASLDAGQQVATSFNDVIRGNWRAIITKLEADVALVPVLGTAAANVLASGLALYDQLSSPGGRAKVILLAYDFALANVPGLAAFQPELDPVVKALVRIAVQGEPPTDAVLDALVESLSDPLARATASALVLLLTHRASIVQSGLDVASAWVNDANLSGDLATQGSTMVGELLESGKDALSALSTAFDGLVASTDLREAWDNFRADYKHLAAQYAPLPEELWALVQSSPIAGPLGTAALNAAQKALGDELGTTEARLKRMLAANRAYSWALAVEAKGGQGSDAFISDLLDANALLPVASRALASDIYGADSTGGPVFALLTAAENARPLLIGLIGGKLVPQGKQAIDAFAEVLGVSL